MARLWQWFAAWMERIGEWLETEIQFPRQGPQYSLNVKTGLLIPASSVYLTQDGYIPVPEYLHPAAEAKLDGQSAVRLNRRDTRSPLGKWYAQKRKTNAS